MKNLFFVMTSMLALQSFASSDDTEPLKIKLKPSNNGLPT